MRTVITLLFGLTVASFAGMAHAAVVNASTTASLIASTPVPSTTDNLTTSPAAAALAVKYQQLKDELTHSVFNAPILLSSNTTEGLAQGEVYAILNAPFASLSETLSQPAHWCELAILHINVKTCTYEKDQVQLFIGRRYYEPPEQAFALQYRFENLSDNFHLSIRLTAPKGPIGTSNYLTSFEAIPIDDDHSFIHFTYHYQFGLVAGLAMETYLATIGRNKVGFTITGADADRQPIYIKGLQGVVERNVMRYIFAIQSVLESQNSAIEFRQKAQLVRWYAHIQEFPRQLVEFTHEEYMDIKQKELANQQAMQQALASP